MLDKTDRGIQVAASFVVGECGVDDFIGVIVAQENFGDSEKADDNHKGNQLLGNHVNVFFAAANDGGVNVTESVNDIAYAVIHVLGGDAGIVDGRKYVTEGTDADRNE